MNITTCPDCLTTTTGPDACNHGAERVTRDLDWCALADHWLDMQPHGYTFTADDLVTELGKPTGSHNQIGAVIRAWSQRNWILGVGYQQATRKESHARALRVWAVV